MDRLSPVTFRLPIEMKQQLRREAERLKLSYSVLVRVAITKFLKELPK